MEKLKGVAIIFFSTLQRVPSFKSAHFDSLNSENTRRCAHTRKKKKIFFKEGDKSYS